MITPTAAMNAEYAFERRRTDSADLACRPMSHTAQRDAPPASRPPTNAPTNPINATLTCQIVPVVWSALQMGADLTPGGPARANLTVADLTDAIISDELRADARTLRAFVDDDR